MSNYTKTTNFAAKDSLPSGNANKIVKGTEIDTEFDNIATASATKADIASPTFTGTVTIPTVDLNGGAIDGTTVGASTAAAITGTTIVANTSVNIAGDGATVTGIKDEDDMSSNSATKLATQQSIKAYVDSQVTAQDLDFQADSGGALSIDLDSETLTFTGGTGVDTSGSGNAVTFAIDSTVTTLTGTQTLTNKTLTSPTLNTPTIGTSFTIGSATITEAELEILDGATVTTAELNVLDGITSTTAELNILDGVTSTAAELNILDGVTSTAAELNILDGVTSTTAELNILDGVTASTAELNIMDGVTSTTAELNILDGVTATATELNLLDGVTATTAELNYVDGVTSAIQTQINTKAPLASPTFTGTVTATGLTVATSNDPASITLRQTGNTSGFILKNFDDDEAQLVNVDNGPMVFKTNDTERLRITGAGAVGVGTASPSTKLQVTGNSSSRNTIVSNVTLDGGTTVANPYEGFGFGINFIGRDYGNAVRNYASINTFMQSKSSSSGGGDAGFTAGLSFYTNGGGASDTNPTERMRIDSSGALVLNNSGGDAQMYFGGTSGTSRMYLARSGTDTLLWNVSNGAMRFGTNNTERLRIDSSGALQLGGTTDAGFIDFDGQSLQLNSQRNPNTGAFVNTGKSHASIGLSGASGGSTITFRTASANNTAATERMRLDASGNFLVGKSVTTIGTSGFQAAANGSLYSSIASSNTYHVYNTTSPAYTFYVNVNGGIYNYSGNNSNLSDEREKKNIENLESQWDSLKQWSLKKFHYNADADSDTKKLGVIAQEVEAHNPEVVSEFNVNENTTRMAVKEQQMMWMAIKALQEAQTRIETLEAKVQQLENN